MSLSTYALISLAELKSHLSIGGATKDPELEEIINRVTDEIESHLGRQLVTRGDLVEFHTMRSGRAAVCTSELHTLDRPVISVAAIHEDTSTPRTYGASALLAAGTAYEVVKPKGIIRRVEVAGVPRNWDVGHRAIKVAYTAGYANTATVPYLFKGVAFRYAALLWGEQKRGDFGISGASDALGNYTRFAPAQLTPEMKAALAGEERQTIWQSGERDA